MNVVRFVVLAAAVLTAVIMAEYVVGGAVGEVVVIQGFKCVSFPQM